MTGLRAVAVRSDPIDLRGLSLDSFAGRPVSVLGLARSGLSLARFMHDRGAKVTVYDGRDAADLQGAIEALEGRPVRLLLGPMVDPQDALRDQALVTTSPSISSRFPTTEPRLRAALGAIEKEGRVPVISEIDLFLRLCPARTVGVTGTKGKTTTSSLSAAVLRAGTAPVVLGGNIGTPLVEQLPRLTADHRVVIELSELQLPTLSRGTDVAVYTHVTGDHLDRHGSLEAYRAVKRRLAELLPSHGALVVNAEDPVSGAYAAPSGARTVSYGRGPAFRGGVGLAQGWIVTDAVPRLEGGEGRNERVMPLDEIPLPGEHSVSNVLAAVAVGALFGIPPTGMRGAVGGFRAVEHRLEPVQIVDGVLFVNDSQGTQPDAVVAALRSFPPPLVLIAGGRDKGVPLDDLAREAVERADAVVLIGESAPLLHGLLAAAGHPRFEVAPDLGTAVERADALARAALVAGRGGHRGPTSTATVLLSPAAASFDMFDDYEARGRAFKAAVTRLAEGRGPSPVEVQTE